MKYIILKLEDIIIVVAECKNTRFEIVVNKYKLYTINVYKYLSFSEIVNSWKSNGYKQIKRFLMRQNNEKDV